MRAREELALLAAQPVRALAALLISLLPRRMWPGFDLPLGAASMASGLATFFAGGVLAVHYYLLFARRMSSLYADRLLEVMGGERSAPPLVANAPMAVAVFAFLVSPAGLATAYMALSGLVRFGAAATDDPQGDPLLTGLDALWQRFTARWRRDRAREAREAQEGPAVPDVLVTGRDGGAPEADFCVLASRRKEGWEKGVFVVTSECWYRIGAPFDRRYPGGLRRVYPITRITDLEVIRRSVYYELPKLGGGASPADPAAEAPR
jgi:hypothetical protein